MKIDLDRTQWFRASWNRDISTGPLAHPLAHLLTVLFGRMLCLSHSFTRSLTRSLTRSWARRTVNRFFFTLQSVPNHCAEFHCFALGERSLAKLFTEIFLAPLKAIIPSSGFQVVIVKTFGICAQWLTRSSLRGTVRWSGWLDRQSVLHCASNFHSFEPFSSCPLSHWCCLLLPMNLFVFPV